MSGTDIKKMIKDSGLKLWQVAEQIGCNDGNFSRMLRHDFDENKVKQIKEVISKLKYR